jgi:hypothetical protein
MTIGEESGIEMAGWRQPASCLKMAAEISKWRKIISVRMAAMAAALKYNGQQISIGVMAKAAAAKALARNGEAAAAAV